MTRSDELPRPLAGVRVLDLSRIVSGPMCGRILADLGADVVKVEPPTLDTTRIVAPGSVGTYFTQMNAGKRNVCIDLKHAQGAQLVAELAAQADVLVENFRPGVLARHGLGPDELLGTNPRLVYCSVTGWGQDGPWRDRPAYAPIVHAEAGTIEMAGRLRGTPAVQEVQIHGDVYPGVMAANAVLAALLQRATTGRGQHLDVAMGEVMLYVNDWAALELQGYDGDRFPFDTWTHPVVELGDGTQVALLGKTERMLATWVRVLGLETRVASVTDDDLDVVCADPERALEVLREVMRGVPDAAAFDARQAGGAPVGAVLRSVRELGQSEWAVERDVVTEVQPGVPIPRAPWRSTGASVGATAPAAACNADAVAVLGEWLGYDEDAVRALTSAGALQDPVV
jgi:crotonobetainyl-CoA:carnitine CoA-transferase CaiB-like acyl-CoA transferase